MSRTIVVVGGSSGIGRALAHQLAARGDTLVLAARGKGPLEQAAQECRDAGSPSVTAVSLDVRESEAVEQLAQDVVREHGRVDAVVVTAGVAAYGQFVDLPQEVFEGVIRTNLFGSANVARAFLPVLRQQGAGVLVLTSSVIGEIAAPEMTAYAVSKWAVRSLGRQLALEQRDHHDVHVVTMSIGAVDTPIYAAAGNYEGHEGKPPFPVYSADKMAASFVHAIDHPKDRQSVGWANPVMRLGFSVLPRVFDVVVTPAFRVFALRPGHQEPTPGNVLEPVEEKEQVDAGYSRGIRDVLDRLAGR